MSAQPIALRAILLSTAGLSHDQVLLMGKAEYQKLYLDHGTYGLGQTHDLQTVHFWENRFEHAFYTSSDRIRHPDAKDLLSRERVDRVRWIGIVISGQVQGTACWETPSPTGRRIPPNRLYVVYSENYVVWLEPRMSGGWKFSTAYVAEPRIIRQYCNKGKRIWAYK